MLSKQGNSPMNINFLKVPDDDLSWVRYQVKDDNIYIVSKTLDRPFLLVDYIRHKV